MKAGRASFAAVTAIVALIVGVVSVAPSAYSTYAKWPASTAIVYINAANQDGLSASSVVTALRAAMDIWATQGGANFSFTYGGQVSQTTTGYDNKNLVVFRNESPGYIAYTSSWVDSSNRLLDSDMLIYDPGFTFYSVDGMCTYVSGQYGVYLRDLATHEFGHMLGLLHSGDAAATMAAGYEGCSTTQRSLESDDVAGVQALYGKSTAKTNAAPSVIISSPSNNSSFSSGAAITFSASAIDDEDGNLSSSIIWTSSLGGTLGTGASFSKTLTAGTHVISVAVTDSAGVTSTSQVSTTFTPAILAPPSASLDGTQVPGASQIVDSQGAAWTIGANYAILRNGVSAAGGAGSTLLWSGGILYAFGTDGAWWWWNGYWWTSIGLRLPGGSPDGTQVPGATRIVDSLGAVWTIGPNYAILRNGVSAAGGTGSMLLWNDGILYAFGTNGAWWRWNGSWWITLGAMTPTVASPENTQVPTEAGIVDTQGSVWTIGANSAILRNGFSAASGAGSRLLWSGGSIYAFGTDGAWWRWNGGWWDRL